MENNEQDIHFLIHNIINEIAKYANKNGMVVDDTIITVADWLYNITDIATLNNYKGYEEG